MFFSAETRALFLDPGNQVHLDDLKRFCRIRLRARNLTKNQVYVQHVRVAVTAELRPPIKQIVAFTQKGCLPADN